MSNCTLRPTSKILELIKECPLAIDIGITSLHFDPCRLLRLQEMVVSVAKMMVLHDIIKI
jgi:hypothetical protein